MTTDDRPDFDPAELESASRAGRSLGRRTWAFLAALAAIAGLFVYDYRSVEPGHPTVLGWHASRLDWLLLVSVAVLVVYLVVPLVRNRERAATYWRRFRRDRLAVACLGFLGFYVLVATVGAWIVGTPEMNLSAKLQPPVYATSPSGKVTLNCLGELGGTDVAPTCGGTWQYPLGTDTLGRDMVQVLVMGARVSLLVGLIASMIIVPIATAVGTVAGYLGGWVDDVLMSYVDVQQAVPAFVIYLIAIVPFGKSLFMLVLVFGLFSWGGTARLVRSEVRQRRDATYVQAAREAGASHVDTVRRHVVPNVSSTIVTSVARQIPAIVLTEAALAYLLLSDDNLLSWGVVIKQGMRQGYGGATWWMWVFPALFLAATAFAFSIVGDALRDALDPRGER
jgi:peptide/nickel transport system permease protein